VPKLAYYERNVTLGDLNRVYSYEKTVGLVGDTFRDLDPVFYDIFVDMVQNGKIDVFPEKASTTGLFVPTKGLLTPVIFYLTTREN